MRAQVRVGSLVCWVVAWLMALGGAASYLLWPGDWVWLAGSSALIPLFVLAAWRGERKDSLGDRGGSADAVWGPPGSDGGAQG